MRLDLRELKTMHPALGDHQTDYGKCGALALQRAGHTSPKEAAVDHDGAVATVEVVWQSHDLALLEVSDDNAVTEDGAEAVALSYVHALAGWVVKRRLQRGLHADWLLRDAQDQRLALEISGTTTSNHAARLTEKLGQLGQCPLRVGRLAVVVGFPQPLILASRVR